MEKAEVAYDIPRRTNAVEAYKKLLSDVARDWNDDRNRISGMSLCLRPSVSTIVTKALRIIGPSLRFIPL